MRASLRLIVVCGVTLLSVAGLLAANPAWAGLTKADGVRKHPQCASNQSDPDQHGVMDDWGFENGISCRVGPFTKLVVGSNGERIDGGLHFGPAANDPLAKPDVLDFDPVPGPDPWDDVEIPVPDNVIQGPWGVNPRPAEPTGPQGNQGDGGHQGGGCGGCGSEGLGDGGQNVGDADAFGDD